MPDGAEIIRRQMQQTRSALGQKIETFRRQIAAGPNNTSHEATQAMKDCCEVGEKLERHPWWFFGGAVALGFFSPECCGKNMATTPSRSRRGGMSRRTSCASRTKRRPVPSMNRRRPYLAKNRASLNRPCRSQRLLSTSTRIMRSITEVRNITANRTI